MGIILASSSEVRKQWLRAILVQASFLTIEFAKYLEVLKVTT